MKLVFKLLGGLLALILVLVVVSFFLPRHYHVERSVVIKSTPEAVHAQLADLRSWKNWGVWNERDPEIKATYSEQQMVIGAWSAWESKMEGNGKVTLTEVLPTKVAYLLEFPDYEMKCDGSLSLTLEAEGVKVLWVAEGDLKINPLCRWMGLFLDSMIGPDFEVSLAKLKRNLEK